MVFVRGAPETEILSYLLYFLIILLKILITLITFTSANNPSTVQIFFLNILIGMFCRSFQIFLFYLLLSGKTLFSHISFMFGVQKKIAGGADLVNEGGGHYLSCRLWSQTVLRRELCVPACCQACQRSAVFFRILPWSFQNLLVNSLSPWNEIHLHNRRNKEHCLHV